MVPPEETRSQVAVQTTSQMEASKARPGHDPLQAQTLPCKTPKRTVVTSVQEEMAWSKAKNLGLFPP